MFGDEKRSESEWGGESAGNPMDPGSQPKPEQDQTPQPDDESKKGSG